MQKALIFYGGWEGHEPEPISRRLEAILKTHGFDVVRVAGMDCLLDGEALMGYDLIVPCMTMGTLPREAEKNVCHAVRCGVGLAGCHGGMCDAFRNSTDWQFMTGGQWVAHPGNDGTEYTVNICRGSRCWLLPVFPWRPARMTAISRLTCRWPGPSTGDRAGFSTAHWGITMTYLKNIPR